MDMSFGMLASFLFSKAGYFHPSGGILKTMDEEMEASLKDAEDGEAAAITLGKH